MVKRLILLSLIFSVLLLTACGGSSVNADKQGEVIIGLTDADGDFLTYAVSVKSLTLTQDSGVVVNTLPLAEGAVVDFTQYTELTEFFTAATIPAGKYVKATMVLDYAGADIQVEVNGLPVSASVQDAEGAAISELELTVSLTNHGGLVVVPGVPAHLTLDFDLEASNHVDLSNPVDPVVTVEPVLVADLLLDDPKETRMRGLFHSVDDDDQAIKLSLQPFFKTKGDYGKFKAYVSNDTLYEVDGVAYSGDAGLTEVAALDRGTWVVVLGKLNTQTRHYEASEVYAGSSVPGSDLDVVQGAVTARTGDVLTVNASTVVKTEGGLLFNVAVTVNLAEDTPVSRQLSNGTFNKDDISVGQRIVFAGVLDGNVTDGLTMTYPERVRMLLSQAAGSVVSTDAVNSELVLNVKSMNARRVVDYDFTGTGIDASNDADAANYQVATSTLPLDSYDVAAPVKVRGFVTPFASAPADFDAQTIVSVMDEKSRMMINWTPTVEAPFVSLTTDAMVVSLADMTGPLHHVRRKGIHTDLLQSGIDPVIMPATIATGVYTIHQGGPVAVYADFAEFSIALNARLDAGSRVRHISADGYYTDVTSTLRAQRISVMMNPAKPAAKKK